LIELIRLSNFINSFILILGSLILEIPANFNLFLLLFFFNHASNCHLKLFLTLLYLLWLGPCLLNFIIYLILSLVVFLFIFIFWTFCILIPFQQLSLFWCKLLYL
jgi:hypothetical protein